MPGLEAPNPDLTAATQDISRALRYTQQRQASGILQSFLKHHQKLLSLERPARIDEVASDPRGFLVSKQTSTVYIVSYKIVAKCLTRGWL